jgi:hypothetical protein
VGADGANSAIGKKLAGPLPPAEMEVAFGYRAPLPKSVEAATVVAFLPKWVGYAWAFPRIDHVSFGIATTQDAFDHEKLDSLLWDFMVSYYQVSQAGNSSPECSCGRKRRVKRKLRICAGPPSVTPRASRAWRRVPGTRAKLVAKGGLCWVMPAGFADPVTGEGIYYAIRSAELFAETYLAGAPMAYEQKWRADFGAELKRASQMRRRFYGNFWGAPFTDRMIGFARGHRGIRKVLGQLVAGDQGYTNLKKKLARSAVKPDWVEALLACEGENSLLDVILKSFENPDETRHFEKGKFEIVQIGGMTVGRATYEPGWKWSLHVSPLPARLCALSNTWAW